MKTILNKPHGRLLSCSYAASTTLFTLALALLLWGCTKEEEELAPLRESIKTVINTRPPAFVATDSVKLSAEVLEIGQAPILDAGFVLSENAEPNLEKGTLYKISDVKETGPYSLVVKKLQANRKY
ncbi:MAG: hypothetical protein LPK03_02735, partial [Pontibacter sp.]|nr:hypothetical protein [Pontibacter sp.]